MVDLGAGKKASGPPGFEDVVGQAEFKEALLAVAASGGLSGLLVQGEKGTAKSTTVRALSDLLPEQRAVEDCPYGCPPDDPPAQCSDCRDRPDPLTTTRPVPLVTLPLGATRDRVVGTLSVEDALDGAPTFEPGLLARANRGILYVDEVNLLDDHLVDVLLDVAASGVNRVERDGVSREHPADFTLIGTMNPEEGQLRPQLCDRFDLQVTVTACGDIEDRVAIIEGALGRGSDSGTASETSAGERLRTARSLLTDDGVTLPREFAAVAAEVARDAGVDGHRADIAIARTALALAALDGRTSVIESDIERAARYALPHRLAARPFEDAPATEDVLADHFDTRETDETGTESAGESERQGEDDAGNDEERGDTDETDHRDGESGEAGSNGEDAGDRPEPPDEDESDGEGPASDGRPQSGGDSDGGQAGPVAAGDGPETTPDADGTPATDDGDAEKGRPLLPGQSRAAVGEASGPDLALDDVIGDAESARGGSRVETPATTDGDGPRCRTRSADDGDRVDAAASIRAAARAGRGAVTTRDLRASVRSDETGTLVTFVVDASASMRPAMAGAKGVVMELLTDSYQHRDQVAFVSVAGADADVLLPPTDSVRLAARHLKELPTGDRTPLAEGLRTACEVIERADPAASVTVVVTDGRANGDTDSPVAAVRAAGTDLAAVTDELLVVDASSGGHAGVTDVLVTATGCRRVSLDALAADDIDALASDARD